MLTSRLLHRLTFAGIITYIATQAHGWAGGYATKPLVTLLVWIGVTAISLVAKRKSALLALAIVTQLGIHFGTLGSHAHHHMQMSAIQMAYAHIAAGVIAWILLVFSERAYVVGSQALRFVLARFRFLCSVVEISAPEVLAQFSFEADLKTVLLNHVVIRRGPPAFSSN